MPRSGSDAWFVYTRTPGKVSAAPANLKGWAALIGCIALSSVFARLVVGWLLPMSPVLAFGTLAIIIVASVLLTIRLAIWKGRPA